MFYCIPAIRDILRLNMLLFEINKSHSNYKITRENFENFKNISKETKILCTYLCEYNGRYYINQDIHNIMPSIISTSIIKSKLFPTGASILTGLGVLGTFVGLLKGLSGFELSGEGLESFRQQIKIVTSGASTAFATSVVGVFLSLVLTIIGKAIISKLSNKIYKIETLLCNIFPYYPLISVFTSIQNDSKETTDILGGLAEKIGDNMQKSISNLSDNLIQYFSKSITDLSKYLADSIGTSINETITKALVPSINKISEASIDLASRQASGSEEVMKNLIEEFTTKIGDVGTNQRDAIIKVTDDMKNCMIDFTNEINKNLIRFADQQENMQKIQLDNVNNINAIIKNINDEHIKNIKYGNDNLNSTLDAFTMKFNNELQLQTDQMKKITNEVQNSHLKITQLMTDFFEKLVEFQNNSIYENDKRAKIAQDKYNEITTSQGAYLEKINNTIEAHVKSTQNILNQGSNLQEKIENNNLKYEQNLKALDRLAKELNQSCQNLGKFSTSIENSVNKNSETTNNAMRIMSQISDSNSSLTTEFKNMLSGVDAIRASLKLVTSNLDSSINKSKESFDTLCNNYKSLETSLKQHYEELNLQNSSYIEQINDQVSKLLIDYGKQVQTQLSERMQDWNMHTQDYCDKMIEVSNAFQDIIDRMDQIKIK